MYCLSAVGILGYGIYKIEILGSDYEQSHQTIAEQEMKEKAYYDVVQIVETTADSREALGQFFLTEKDTIRFIATIENYAKNQGVSLETTQLAVDPKTEKTEKTEKAEAVLRIGFTYEGTEQAVEKMSVLFETLPYHKRIPEFTIQKSIEGEWTGTILLLVTITP